MRRLPSKRAALRCPDARRLQVGVVPDALAARLEADGRAVQTQDEPLRLVAGPWVEL